MLKTIFPFIITILIIVLFLNNKKEIPKTIPLTPTKSNFVTRLSFKPYSIRLLVLKHCPDSIANTDSNEAVQAANLAASNGLDIKNIGNYHVNKEGRTNSWTTINGGLEGLKNFISSQMKIDAQLDDTFIVYTIGHGSGSGSIMRLGQREGVMKAIAKAAEENNQRTLWWQLSCHAGAKLPPISILNKKQQRLFSMIASSPANELSYFCTQGARMEKVFLALASSSPEIDPDGDKTVTARELSLFISKKVGDRFGKLVFAESSNHIIFGWYGRIINGIPIIDKTEKGRKYPDDYIKVPNVF